MLLIDDGSTDKSGIICDKYEKDDRVRVFHKKNGGVSSARDYGIEKSLGTYLMFVDSDDYLSNECLFTTFNIIKENRLDFVCFGHNNIKSDASVSSDKTQEVNHAEINIYSSNKEKCWMAFFVYGGGYEHKNKIVVLF